MERLGKSLEDYLETIYLLAMKNKVVRVTDVAKSLGVKKPSVVVALRKLRDEGLVFQERYGYIELTPKGKDLAEDIYFRHQVLLKFFRDLLGVSPDVAERDACIMEHYLSQESLDKLREFMEKWKSFSE